MWSFGVILTCGLIVFNSSSVLGIPVLKTSRDNIYEVNKTAETISLSESLKRNPNHTEGGIKILDTVEIDSGKPVKLSNGTIFDKAKQEFDRIAALDSLNYPYEAIKVGRNLADDMLLILEKSPNNSTEKLFWRKVRRDYDTLLEIYHQEFEDPSHSSEDEFVDPEESKQKQSGQNGLENYQGEPLDLRGEDENVHHDWKMGVTSSPTELQTEKGRAEFNNSKNTSTEIKEDKGRMDWIMNDYLAQSRERINNEDNGHYSVGTPEVTPEDLENEEYWKFNMEDPLNM